MTAYLTNETMVFLFNLFTTFGANRAPGERHHAGLVSEDTLKIFMIVPLHTG